MKYWYRYVHINDNSVNCPSCEICQNLLTKSAIVLTDRHTHTDLRDSCYVYTRYVSYSVRIQSSLLYLTFRIEMSHRHVMTSALCHWSLATFGHKGLPFVSRRHTRSFSCRLALSLLCRMCCRVDCLTLYTSGPLAARLGAERTLQQLRQYYYWPGTQRNVYTWTSPCSLCQKSKPAPSRAHGHLQKVITGAPLDVVAADILSGLPTASDGS